MKVLSPSHPLILWPESASSKLAARNSFRVDELVRRRLDSLKDPREVIADPNALYSGAKLSEKTLLPGKNARLGATRFDTWLTQPAAQIPSSHPQPTAVAIAAKENVSHEKAS